MPTEKALDTYRNKRDFRRTGEPAPQSDKRPQKAPVFVIQQHKASSMHFDFRIEVDGVLASWAVPKGPSTDPREKRLAIRTEDHPLQYAEFEGVIPEGEYGAGAVIVWDSGSIKNISEKDGHRLSLTEALKEGHVQVHIEGEKIFGAYSLIHAKVGDKEENWLLVKEDDEWSDARRNPVSTQPESILSGKTVEELESEQEQE